MVWLSNPSRSEIGSAQIGIGRFPNKELKTLKPLTVNDLGDFPSSLPVNDLRDFPQLVACQRLTTFSARRFLRKPLIVNDLGKLYAQKKTAHYRAVFYALVLLFYAHR